MQRNRTSVWATANCSLETKITACGDFRSADTFCEIAERYPNVTPDLGRVCVNFREKSQFNAYLPHFFLRLY